MSVFQKKIILIIILCAVSIFLSQVFLTSYFESIAVEQAISDAQYDLTSKVRSLDIFFEFLSRQPIKLQEQTILEFGDVVRKYHLGGMFVDKRDNGNYIIRDNHHAVMFDSTGTLLKIGQSNLMDDTGVTASGFTKSHVSNLVILHQGLASYLEGRALMFFIPVIIIGILVGIFYLGKSYISSDTRKQLQISNWWFQGIMFCAFILLFAHFYYHDYKLIDDIRVSGFVSDVMYASAVKYWFILPLCLVHLVLIASIGWIWGNVRRNKLDKLSIGN